MIQNIENYQFLIGGICVVTGHRKIGGYIIPNPLYTAICLKTQEILLKMQPKKCITGGAIGYDQIGAKVAYKLGIPYDVYVPMKGQESRWKKEAQETYYKMLKLAANIILCSEESYSPKLFLQRDDRMVDQLQNKNDYLLACWNGDIRSGTGHTVNYAQQQNKNIIRIDPNKIIYVI